MSYCEIYFDICVSRPAVSFTRAVLSVEVKEVRLCADAVHHVGYFGGQLRMLVSHIVVLMNIGGKII